MSVPLASSYLSLNQESSLLDRPNTTTPLTATTKAKPAPAWLIGLLGEEKANNMLSLLTILVVLLHVYAFIWLFAPEEQFTPAQPLIMQVSMVTVSAPKPQPAPPKPPEPKKQPVVKPLKKPPPIVQKAPDFAPVQAPEPPAPAPAAAATPSPVSAPAPVVEQFTEANFRANYLHNPKPEYPAIAKSRGWQGKVMLRVQVSADGNADAVSIDTSSGHEMLDEAAIDAVKKWKFIAAKRGETAVPSAVIVPIIFSLRE